MRIGENLFRFTLFQFGDDFSSSEDEK